MNLLAQLSPRETQVAEIMAFTKNKADAADKLCISEGTLSAHTYRIYEKLEINSKSELVIWWMVAKMEIKKNMIPYFKMVPILFFCYGLNANFTKISRRTPKRVEISKPYVSSK